MSFTELLQIPELAERYQKVKKYFFLKESTYDITSACQLRCEGCYYFAGEKHQVEDNENPDAWRAFFEEEKRRGITYVVLAGAEPSLRPKILQACYDVIPLGIIASNGLRKIDPALRYKIHLSIWGDSTGDPKYRKYLSGRPGPYSLPIQFKNYKDDDRVIFIYTFNRENTDQLDEVLRLVSGEGHKISFNVFSAPEESQSPLILRDRLLRTRDKMFEAMDRYGDTVVYSHYNALVHTSETSLHEQFTCVYPRAQRAAGLAGVGIGQTFRSYRANLTHVPDSDCCVPDIDCSDCRHYGAGSAIVPSRLNLHVNSEEQFRGWLDYVDSYLATWVLGYQKGKNLYQYTGGEVPLPNAGLPLRGRL